MSSFNKVSLMGNVGRDPEVLATQGGKKVAKFSLATSEKYTGRDGNKNENVEWHSIVVWEKLAELVEKYVKKGSSLIVEGKIQYRNYENKEGQKVYITEIIGREIYFTGKKESETANTPTDNQGVYQKTEKPAYEVKNDLNNKLDSDELNDLPF